MIYGEGPRRRQIPCRNPSAAQHRTSGLCDGGAAGAGREAERRFRDVTNRTQTTDQGFRGGMLQARPRTSSKARSDVPPPGRPCSASIRPHRRGGFDGGRGRGAG